MTTMTNEQAFEAMLAHHASLVDGVEARVTPLGERVAAGLPVEVAVADLVAFLATEVLPHASAEEATIYPAAGTRAELAPTVAEMTNEHRMLASAIERLARSEGKEAAEEARAIAALFRAHVGRENDILLPALLADPEAGLAELLGEMHDQLVGSGGGEPVGLVEQVDAPADAGDGALLSLFLKATERLAKAGERDAACRLAARAWAALRRPRPDLASRVTAALHGLVRLVAAAPVRLIPRAPSDDAELDVRSLPPAARHESIFARYGALEPGEAFVLVNDHDPKPLRYQFEAEHAGQFIWDYLEDGPGVWRVRIGRPADIPAA